MSRIGGKERVIPASTASEEHTATSADMLSALPLSFILSGIVSYAYLFFTIGCSIGFVLLISEYTTNDHWWREFNTTGGHTFVADVFNTRINMGQLGDFDLFASSLPKDYSTPNTFIDMRPTSVRKILLSSIPLEKVVTTIRTNGLYENIFTIIPYCWVDFSHRFEMAHTAKRQLRCALRQYDNAAVHLETLARNVDPTDWAQSSYGVQINQIIFSAVVQTTEGSAWLAALNAHKWGAVSDEVAFWQQNGLTRFTIQSQNRFLLGYENTITVVNALGVGRWMTTHSVPFIVAGLATWTTKQIAAGLWNDLTKCVTFGCTLLRNKNNSLEALGRNWDTTYMGSAQNTSGDLAREFLGPLVNWDTYYVAPPASLVDVVVKFQGQLYNRLQTDSAFSSVYESIKEVDIDVTPPGWDEIGISYFGGNPLCAPLAQAKPYIQMPFSFDDACQVQERFSIRFGRLGVLFSAWVSQLALSDVGTVCNCSDIHAMYCNDIFASAQNLVSDFIKPSNIQTIVQDIRSLNLLFIQFATQNTTKRLLTQPVVQSPNDQWSAFGWITLFDWTYLGNFYNQNLQYMNATTSIDITAPEFGALAAITNTTVMTVAVAPLSAIAVHDVSNSLANVIEGLRRMDGCQVPWIMTIYCYVDFKRQWEMAPTQSMQDRCKNDQNNGAIYLESLLRNADAESLSDCWGQSLEIAVFSYLKSFANGKEWLSDTRSSKLSVSDEVKYWLASNLTRYTTQWQNYKSLGVAEFFFIQNAFGLTYPLTLKYLNSSFQLSVQTSFKMQWPLAQILTAILSNASALSGKSLIRMSPMYAFVNSTSEDALVSAGVLSSPLGPSLSLVRNLLGPFGSVSMRRVAVPNLLREWYQNVSFEMMKFLSSSRDIQSAYWPAYTSTTIAPRPRAWEGATLGGGNIMCDVAVATMTGTLPGVFYSSTGSCGVNVQEFFVHETSMWLMVFLATGPVNITALVQMETRNPASTKVNLILSTAFFKGYFPNDKYLVLHQQAQTVQALIANESRISIAQFLRRGSELSLSIFPLFNETEPDFDFFSWLYLFDWVQGQREVVSFEGGNSTVALMSSMTPFGGVEANPAEMPTNVAYLMRWLMQYITWVLLFVACIVCIYILRVRGHVEGSNMVSFTRVASLVWLGRPLIFVRAIAALCLLSTSSLVLERPLNGLISHLTAAPQPWYTIILAAGELNWIVYIINDIFSVVTNEYTQMYSFLCYLAVWVASAILSFVSPPSVSVSIERVCSVAQVDFQVECHSGTVVIGSLRQLLVLLGLVLGLCTICFSIVRVFYRKLLFKDSRSLFLYAAARHQFRMTNWEYNDMVFLDKASAVLTGLLSIEFGDTLYVFDIKTWRMHGCPLHQTTSDMGDLPTHLMHAVPLVDL
ncbi:hypothetical protein Ae201684P_021918 [Aphanomyces euteiches]|nr:hypothetical protein Ae201684P_021918 [Aphanomyces euteiches]